MQLKYMTLGLFFISNNILSVSDYSFYNQFIDEGEAAIHDVYCSHRKNKDYCSIKTLNIEKENDICTISTHEWKSSLPYIEIVFNKEKRVFIIRDVDKKNAQVINELSEKEIKWFYDGGSYTSLPKEIKLKLKCKDVVFESVLRKMKRN